jgi:hypothetical protein
MADGYRSSYQEESYKKSQFIPPIWKDAFLKVSKVTKIPIIIPKVIPKIQDIRLQQGGRFGLFGNSNGNANEYTIEIGIFKTCDFMPRNCLLFTITGELITQKTSTWRRSYEYMISAYQNDLRLCKKYPIPSCSSSSIQKKGAITLKQLVNQAGFITLTRKIKGFYIPRYCFATGCRPAQIIWEQNGVYQYSASLYDFNRYPLDELVRLANSAIENQP